MTDRLLTAREVADLLGVHVETALKWHRTGKLPAGFRLATGVLRWRRDEVEAWVESTRSDRPVALREERR